MAQLGWRNVDNAKAASFTDITQNKAAETYTNDPIRILDVSADKEHIGDTVLEAFRGSNTGHLFYGEPTQTRADVTKDGNSVKIQIQLNTGTKGSPTFASLFVRNDVWGYLKLDGFPGILAQWNYDISKIERLIDKGTLQGRNLEFCISNMNEFIKQYNETFLHTETLVPLDESLITDVTLGPNYHGKNFTNFIRRLYDVIEKYVSLRDRQIDHKERMIRDRKIELGTKILEGLRHSLANKVVTEVVLLQ